MTNRVAVEKVGRLLADGLEELALEHWAEVEEPESGIPLKVDWDRVLELERLGCLVAFGARRSGRLVGYSGFLVGPSLLGRVSVATNSQIFVSKPYRGWLGVRLILEAERHFRKAGVDRITYHTKLAEILGSDCFRASVAGSILQRLGYDPIEAVHAKHLGEQHGRRGQQRTDGVHADLAAGR